MFLDVIGMCRGGYRVGKIFCCCLHMGGDCGAEARDWLVFLLSWIFGLAEEKGAEGGWMDA
jgi:hypothetical protein